MFKVFNILFFFVFIAIVGTFLYQILKKFLRRQKDDHSPVITVPACVTEKHTGKISRIGTAVKSTAYFAVFQTESGEKLEFQMQSSEYSLLTEKNKGNLKYQGTRYLGFERT